MTPEIQTKIDEAIKYRDGQRAWEVLAMAAKDTQLGLPRVDYIRLNYLRMNAIDADRLLAIIKESILDAFQIPEFDLDSRLADYLELLDYIDVQIDFLFKLKAVLDDHQELLGDKKITVNGQAVSPTIANWLVDYQSMVSSDMKDALGEMRYINTGPNLKTLSADQRQVLQNILKIYDHVTTFINLYQQIPDNLPQQEINEFRNYATKKFEEENGSEFPIIPAPQPLTPLPVTPPVIYQTPAAEVPLQPESVVQSSPAPATYKVPLQNDPDISPQPKKGLIFDMPTNIDLDEEAKQRKFKQSAQYKDQQKKLHEQQVKDQKLAQIQAKLEDLRKRKDA